LKLFDVFINYLSYFNYLVGSMDPTRVLFH